MIHALSGKVLVHNMTRGAQTTSGGIILKNDEGTSEGIHNRWAQVFSVGTDITDIKETEWVLIEHGRWSREINIGTDKLYLVDYPAGVLAASSTRPNSDSHGVYTSVYQACPK